MKTIVLVYHYFVCMCACTCGVYMCVWYVGMYVVCVWVQSLIELVCDVQAMEDTVVEMKYDTQKAPLG